MGEMATRKRITFSATGPHDVYTLMRLREGPDWIGFDLRYALWAAPSASSRGSNLAPGSIRSKEEPSSQSGRSELLKELPALTPLREIALGHTTINSSINAFIVHLLDITTQKAVYVDHKRQPEPRISLVHNP